MNERQKMILAELRLQYKEGLKCWDSLDHKLIAMLLMGFLGAMVMAVRPDSIPWHPLIFWPCLGVTILSLIGLSPQTFRSPIRLDWEALWEDYLSANDEDAYKQLVSNYLDAFAVNERRARRKVWALKGSLLLLGAQVLLILASAI